MNFEPIEISLPKEAIINSNCLWSQEWFKLENETISSQMLHQKLFLLENHPGIKSKLKQAVLRSSNASQPKENEEEVMKIRPRKFVFPEAEEEGLNIFCYDDVPLAKGQKERWYVELERDVYNKDFLMIPMLEDGRGPADEEEEVIKFPAKAYKHLEQNYADLPKIKSTDSGMIEICFLELISIFTVLFLYLQKIMNAKSAGSHTPMSTI